MGWQRKTQRIGKVYNMSEALAILKQPGFEHYTTVEQFSGGYKIVTIEESKRLEEGNSRKNFVNRIQRQKEYTTTYRNGRQKAKEYLENIR